MENQVFMNKRCSHSFSEAELSEGWPLLGTEAELSEGWSLLGMETSSDSSGTARLSEATASEGLLRISVFVRMTHDLAGTA